LGFLLACIPMYIALRCTQVASMNGRVIILQNISFFGAYIVSGPLLFVVFLTLLSRTWRGENILKPHSEHLYQQLVHAGYAHRTVLLLHIPYYLWNGLMGFMAMRIPIWEVQCAALTFAAVSWLYYWALVKVLVARSL